MNAFRTTATIAWASLLVAGPLGSISFAVNIETVPVGTPGNLGEMSGTSAGGYGPDRYCGAMNYSFRIAKYEVTAGQYTEFLNNVAGVDTYGLYNADMSRTDYGSGIARSGGGTVSDPYTYSAAPEFANRPVNYVSFWNACRFANWLHNGQPTGTQGTGTTETGAYALTTSGINNNTVTRNEGWTWAVTSEDEWYKAAYYKGGSTDAGYWDYPTSSDTAPGQSMADAAGNNANYYAPPYAYPIDSDMYTTLVGEFQNSPSPYGTFDQGGNVFEWTESIVYIARVRRGGSFNASGITLHAAGRDYRNPTTADYSCGFRVSRNSDPGVDSDGDGVPDVNDLCPNTPSCATVDANGCPIDSDGDGVPDGCDQCPNTPPCATVDANGCPIDSDGDGVPDGCDQCPNTVHGATVDADGCPPFIAGDFDIDGDVDQDDLDRFQQCASGPMVPLAGGCEDTDFDADDDVDQDDFGVVQCCYSGANRPADPNCTTSPAASLRILRQHGLRHRPKN